MNPVLTTEQRAAVQRYFDSEWEGTLQQCENEQEALEYLKEDCASDLNLVPLSPTPDNLRQMQTEVETILQEAFDSRL